VIPTVVGNNTVLALLEGRPAF